MNPLSASRFRCRRPSPGDLAEVARIELEADDAWAFHRSLPMYAPTPLTALPALAGRLGLGGLWVKDESARFGLNAFKVLGASYAVHRLECEMRNAECGAEAPGRSDDSELQIANSALLTFTTATDGNHGRAVAWSARAVGQSAVVFMPAGSVPARVQALESEGAKVVVIDGDYDAAVRAAETAARDNGWLLVQDTAWPGYERIPAWIMAGYVTMLREMEQTLLPRGKPDVDVVMLQAGVGSWAAAAAWYLCRRYGVARPRIVCVEPVEADGLLASALAGRRASSCGTGKTIMAGLNCPTPSTLAWDILGKTADAFLAIDDDYARQAMRLLYRPGCPPGGDGRIVAGESGAAGLAGALAMLSEPALARLRSHLGLGPTSRVLVFNTEGATDPDGFAAICGPPAGG